MRKKVLFVDAGIVDLVKALNQIKGAITIASCDGHGVQHAWVNMYCPPDAADVLLNLVLRKKGAYIRIVHGNRTAWYDVMPYSGEAFCSDKSSGKIVRKAMEFSEAVSIVYEIVKDAQNKVDMSIGFPKECNDEPVPILKQRFLEDLAQNGLLEEECPFDVRPVPEGAYSAIDKDPQPETIFVRGTLEVKEEEFVYGFLRDRNKHTFVQPNHFNRYTLKAGDIIEGDSWNFYDVVRSLGLLADCILRDAEEFGRSLDEYFILLYTVRTINGEDAKNFRR
jgi:hypothetical protein